MSDFKCPMCEKEINILNFTHDSYLEFYISGLCQECQDKVFDCCENDE